MANWNPQASSRDVNDPNWILFGRSPLHKEDEEHQQTQSPGQGQQEEQQQQQGLPALTDYQDYHSNTLNLKRQQADLFQELRKTTRTKDNRKAIRELEREIARRRLAIKNIDNPLPLFNPYTGSVESREYHWRDGQGNYHTTLYKPNNTYTASADGKTSNGRLLRAAAAKASRELHHNNREYLPEVAWCVICGDWHYESEIRHVDILMWEAFGNDDGLFSDEYISDKQQNHMPMLPICQEWALLWEWGVIALVPGRTQGSWMLKVVHPDFDQAMRKNYPRTEGRQLQMLEPWSPNPRHMYLRWAIMELLRIHAEGTMRPIVPARGVLYWENGIVDYELGPWGCDLTMIITRLGFEIAGLDPEETQALFDIPEELADRAQQQMEQPRSNKYWEPRFHKFIEAYLGWSAVLGAGLSEYRKNMGIPPFMDEDDDVGPVEEEAEEEEEETQEEDEDTEESVLEQDLMLETRQNTLEEEMLEARLNTLEEEMLEARLNTLEEEMLEARLNTLEVEMLEARLHTLEEEMLEARLHTLEEEFDMGWHAYYMDTIRLTLQEFARDFLQLADLDLQQQELDQQVGQEVEDYEGLVEQEGIQDPEPEANVEEYNKNDRINWDETSNEGTWATASEEDEDEDEDNDAWVINE